MALRAYCCNLGIPETLTGPAEVSDPSVQRSSALGPPICIKTLRLIPPFDKEGAIGWLTYSICPMSHQTTASRLPKPGR
jgi:hypothetical protein